MKTKDKILNNKIRRAHRVRAHIGKRIGGDPRLTVFRSNAHMYAQVIDDKTGRTLASASSLEAKKKANAKKDKKVTISKEIGLLVAERAKKAGVTRVVFDRGNYQYHGRVKSLAEGAREGGLIF